MLFFLKKAFPKLKKETVATSAKMSGKILNLKSMLIRSVLGAGGNSRWGEAVGGEFLSEWFVGKRKGRGNIVEELGSFFKKGFHFVSFQYLSSSKITAFHKSYQLAQSCPAVAESWVA